MWMISAFDKALIRAPFRWGASLALLPALLGLPAASYAGIAVVNMLWKVLFGRDSPGPVYFVGGLFYGLTFCVLLQCFLLGAAGDLVWRVSSRRLEPMLLRKSRFAKAAIWVGMEAIVIPVSFCMTMMAYGGPVLLAWLFGLGGK